MSSERQQQQQQEYILNQQKLQIDAFKRYEARINSYRLHYGPYDHYIDWCNAQYELECIPEDARRGSMAGTKAGVFGTS